MSSNAFDSARRLNLAVAAREGVDWLVREAEAGRPSVIHADGAPVAAFVPGDAADRLDHIDELEEDLRLLTRALLRVASDSGRRYSLDDVEREGDFDS